MLILTRKPGQKVLINKGSIQVKVIGIEDDIITIGFLAPDNVDIDREEIFWQKLSNRTELAAAS